MMKSDGALHFNFENIFPPGDKEHIAEYYGDAFLQKVLHDIETYVVKWELDDLHFVSYFSVTVFLQAIPGSTVILF